MGFEYNEQQMKWSLVVVIVIVVAIVAVVRSGDEEHNAHEWPL